MTYLAWICAVLFMICLSALATLGFDFPKQSDQEKYPRAIASDMSSVPHGWLVLLLLGMSFCFVYGVGFKARNRFLAFLFSPLVAWTCVGVASFMIFFQTPVA